MKNKVLKNSFWLIYDKVFRLLGIVIFNLLLANNLGADFVGEYHFIIAVSYIFYAISLFGLNDILIKELVSLKYSISELLTNSLILRLIVGMLLYILIIIITFCLSGYTEINLLYLLIVGLQLFFQPFQVLTTYFDSQINSRITVIFRNIAVSISVTLRILLVLFYPDLRLILLAYIIEPFLEGLILFIYFQKNILTLKLKDFKVSIIKYLIKQSGPIAFASIFYIMYAKLDQLMLGFMVSKSELGNYSMAVRFAEISFFIPIAYSKSLFPKIVAFKEDKQQYNKMITKAMKLLFRISLCISLVMLIIPDSFFTYILGEDMVNVSIPFKILIFSSIMVYIGSLSYIWYLSEGYQNYIMYNTVYGLLFNIILNLILIHYYGIIGAAVATLLAKILANYIIHAFRKETREIFYIQTKSIFNFKLNS